MLGHSKLCETSRKVFWKKDSDGCVCVQGVDWSSDLKFPVYSRPNFFSTNSKMSFIVFLKPTYRNGNFNIIYVVRKQLFIYKCQTYFQPQTEVINIKQRYKAKRCKRKIK